MRRSGDLVAWWCHDPPRDRAPGFALRIIGPLRSVDQPDRRTAPRGPDDQANRGAAQRGRVSHPKIPEGLHEHVGAEALVALRADPWEDRDQATRSPRVVVAGLGPRASNASGQAAHLGDTRLGSLAAGPAARSVGRLGRWARTTPTMEAHGRLAFEQVCRTNVVMKKVISFEILIPDIHSTWIGDQAL